VKYINSNEANLVATLKNNSEQLTQWVHLSLARCDRFAGVALENFLLSNSVCSVTPYWASQSRRLPSIGMGAMFKQEPRGRGCGTQREAVPRPLAKVAKGR